MFGYNSNNKVKSPSVSHSFITPTNYGMSHVFLDDDSQLLLELEHGGNIPTTEIAKKIKNTAAQRTKEAATWKRIGKDLKKLSKANSEITKQATSAKLTVARASKNQYDSVSRMFNSMERLASDYELTKEHRNQTVRDIRANYQEAIANLRNNSNKSQNVTTKTGLT